MMLVSTNKMTYVSHESVFYQTKVIYFFSQTHLTYAAEVYIGFQILGGKQYCAPPALVGIRLTDLKNSGGLLPTSYTSSVLVAHGLGQALFYFVCLHLLSAPSFAAPANLPYFLI